MSGTLTKQLKDLFKNLQILKKVFAFLLRGYYLFNLKYFDSLERGKLDLYTGWHLDPSIHFYLQLEETSIDEFESLSGIIRKFFPDPPKKVLELGFGTGRSTIFFMQMFHWPNTRFILADGHKQIDGKWDTQHNQSQTGFHKDIKNLANSYYANFPLARLFLNSNKVKHYKLVDINRNRNALSRERNIQLLYSFHCIGYHYDIWPIMDYYRINQTLCSGALLIFGIRKQRDSHSRKLSIGNVLNHGFKKICVIRGGMLEDYLVIMKQ